MSDPSVFIIDDDPSARQGLTRLVRAAGMNAESFASAGEFLASGNPDGPGCIVLDVRMPGMTGPELQEELCRSDYCMPIIFISAHGDVPITADVMKKGALDFLTKPVDCNDLLEAIERALEKDRQHHAEIAQKEDVRRQLSGLTPREFEIMTYVIAGLLNKQIAYELGISDRTVKIHRGRVMVKTGVDSVAELVRLTEEIGIKPAQHGV